MKEAFQSLRAGGALTAAAFAVLAVFLAAGLLAPWLAPYGIEDMDLMARLVPPFTHLAHPLGTDDYLLNRVI